MSALLALMPGCAAEAVPELLDVREVGPATLERGTSLEVRGSGFPERRSGRVQLEGTVFTAARRARSARVEWPALAESRSRIEVTLSQRELAAFTEGAQHVTFRGKVSVEFESPRAGGPLLRGESPEVTLDVFLSRGATDAAEANVDGQSFADFLGVTLGEGLEVTRVEGDSEGARAGLMPGDRLHRLDGLRLDSLADFSPSAGARVSSIEFSRVGHTGIGTALVDRSAYQPLASSAATSALVLVVALALALLLAARPPRWLVWIFARRDKSSATPAASPSSLDHVVFFGVVLAFWLGLGAVEFSSSPIDLEIALGVVFSSVVAAAFLAGGRRARGGFSTLRALGGALLSLVGALPLFVAAVVRASECGTLRLADLARLQGGNPLHFALVESPWNLCLALGAFAALVPVATGRGARAREEGSSQGAGALLRSIALSSGAALWVVLFLGGAEGVGARSALGGLLLSVKTALVLALVFALRARLGQLRLSEGWGLWNRGALGLAASGALLYGASVWTGYGDLYVASITLGMRWLLVASCVCVGLAIPRAIAHSGRVADPWI